MAELQGEKERQRDRSSPDGCKGWGSAARSLEFLAAHPCGCGGPSTWAIFYHCPRHVIKEVDQKWSIWDTNQFPRGMLALQAETIYCATVPALLPFSNGAHAMAACSEKGQEVGGISLRTLDLARSHATAPTLAAPGPPPWASANSSHTCHFPTSVSAGVEGTCPRKGHALPPCCPQTESRHLLPGHQDTFIPRTACLLLELVSFLQEILRNGHQQSDDKR